MKYLSGILMLFWKGTRFKLRKALGYRPSTPFMKFREIDLLTEVLKNLKPVNCLEYGSGYSSNYFIRYLPDNASWLSVEHDEEWFNEISKDVHDPRVKIHLVKTDGKIGKDLEDPKPFKTYINFPEEKAPFDFILVDGRVRNTCIEKGFKMLKENGVLVIHDANKKLYQQGLAIFPNTLIFEDYRRSSGGIGIGTSARPIDTLLRIKKHASRWKLISFIANAFKFKWLIGGKGKVFKLLHKENDVMTTNIDSTFLQKN